MLSGDQVHLIHFRPQVVKLQGTIFLLPDINVCQPAFSSKLHLAFMSVHMEMSLLPSHFSLFLLIWIYNPKLHSATSALIYLPLLFNLQGNPLDNMTQFSFKFPCRVPTAYILKGLDIFKK